MKEKRRAIVIKKDGTPSKKRTNRQPHSKDAAFIVEYFGIDAVMTSYTRMDQLGQSERVMVYFKPTPIEGKLKSGIEYHVMQCSMRFDPSTGRKVRVESMESEIPLLVKYLEDPPKCRQFARRYLANRAPTSSTNPKIGIK